MADVLSIESFDRDANDLCTVVAVVDAAVVVIPATLVDPEEYGPALCRGTFYVPDDEVIPEDHAELCRFVGDSVLYWQIVDTSDY